MPAEHKNNAAEWLIVIFLTPVRWIVRLSKMLLRSGKKGEPISAAAAKGAKAGPRRSVMIEGLPPRTMN